MDMKYLVIGAVALALLLLARGGKADTNSLDYMGNPRNWDYMPGYRPGSGLMI